MADNLNIFLAELEDLKKKPAEVVEKAQRATIVGIQDRLLAKPQDGGTPIKTGRARASWGIDKDQPGTFVQPSPPPGTEGEIYSAEDAKTQQKKVASVKIGSTWYVYNNVPYIKKLNEGSSSQAPEGFVENAVEAQKAEMQAQLDADRLS